MCYTKLVMISIDSSHLAHPYLGNLEQFVFTFYILISHWSHCKSWIISHTPGDFPDLLQPPYTMTQENHSSK